MVSHMLQLTWTTEVTELQFFSSVPSNGRGRGPLPLNNKSLWVFCLQGRTNRKEVMEQTIEQIFILQLFVLQQFWLNH